MDFITQAKRGSAEAFIQLMEAQKPSMYRTARAILRNDEDAADAIQETILSCYQNLAELKKDRYFKTWLTRILINKCSDIAGQRGHTVSAELVEEPGYSEDCDERLSLQSSLSRLPDPYRLVLLLHYVEGFRVKEIGAMLNLNENTIKTRLSRGREQLKRAYLAEGGSNHG